MGTTKEELLRLVLPTEATKIRYDEIVEDTNRKNYRDRLRSYVFFVSMAVLVVFIAIMIGFFNHGDGTGTKSKLKGSPQCQFCDQVCNS